MTFLLNENEYFQLGDDVEKETMEQLGFLFYYCHLAMHGKHNRVSSPLTTFHASL